MKSHRIAYLQGLILLCFTAATASALRANLGETPTATLQAAVEEVLAIAYPSNGSITPSAMAAQVRPILDRTMDFDAITRRAVGPGWREFTAAERRRAVELFAALIVRTYVARLTEGGRPQIAYKPPVAVGSGYWEVPTQVRRGGTSYAIVYRLELRADGWRIYDIIAEGVSFVANYRSQFEALAQKGGAAAVLRALEARQPAAARR